MIICMKNIDLIVTFSVLQIIMLQNESFDDLKSFKHYSYKGYVWLRYIFRLKKKNQETRLKLKVICKLPYDTYSMCSCKICRCKLQIMSLKIYAIC